MKVRYAICCGIIGDAPGGNRTPDADLRTISLYPLSYEGRSEPTHATHIFRWMAHSPNALLPKQKQGVWRYCSGNPNVPMMRPKGLGPPAYRSATCRSIH